MHNPWLQMMQAMVPQAAPNLCAPQKMTVTTPWGPVMAMAMDPRTNPWLAMGMAFGPMAWVTAWQTLHQPAQDEAAHDAATEELVQDMPV